MQATLHRVHLYAAAIIRVYDVRPDLVNQSASKSSTTQLNEEGTLFLGGAKCQ